MDIPVEVGHPLLVHRLVVCLSSDVGEFGDLNTTSDFLWGQEQGLVPPAVKWYLLADTGTAVSTSHQEC